MRSSGAHDARGCKSPGLVFPTAPVDATDDKSRRIGHGEAECLSDDLMAGVRDAHGTLRGMRIGPWLDPEEEEFAEISDIDRERWRDLTWDGFSHVADNDLTRTGSQEVTGGDLLLGRSFLFTAGFAAATDDRWLEWRQSAPMRSSGAHDAYGDGLIGLFGADGERDRLLAGVALSGSTKIRRIGLPLQAATPVDARAAPAASPFQLEALGAHDRDGRTSGSPSTRSSGEIMLRVVCVLDVEETGIPALELRPECVIEQDR